jgi:hypothetical protein
VIFALAKNGIWASSFVPCAVDHSLLKELAVAEKRAVARRVLLYLTGSLKRIDLIFSSNPHRVSFKSRLIKHDNFNPPRGFERENFVAENSTTQPQHERTQLAPNQ